MTALSKCKTLVPTDGRSSAQSSGASIDNLLTLLRTRIDETAILLREIVSITPSKDPNLAVLKSALAELV